MPYDHCPSCGAELPFREADICWKCGFRLKPLPEGAEESDKKATTIAVGLMAIPLIILIIAVVVAAIVFGMASGVQKTKAVAATVRQTGSDIVVTWQGGRDNAMVTGYSISLTNSAGSTFDTVIPGNEVGNSTKAGVNMGTSGYDHVVVMASFTDKSQQVVLDTYV